MTLRWRRLLASLVFLAGLFAIVQVLSVVLHPYSYTRDTWRGYQSLAPGSVDVIVVGNSHSFTSVAPMQLWRDRRITSWDVGASAINQRTKRAYVEVALARQRPKVVVLEVHSLQQARVQEDRETAWAYDYMPFGLPKVLALLDTAAPSLWERHLIQLEEHHQNYANLRSSDFTRFLGLSTRPATGGAKALSEPPAKGGDAAAAGTAAGLPSIDETPSVDRAEIAACKRVSEAEIRRIAELCRARGSRLVLWLAPVQTGYTGADDPLPGLQQKLSSEFPDIVYVNGNEHKAEIGLIDADFRDWGHLYAWGMAKNTAWLAEHVLAPLGVTGPSATPDAAWWDEQAAQWDPPGSPR